MVDQNDGGAESGDDGDVPQPASTDEHVRELQAKIGALVANNFGGDYQSAFNAYDANQDGGIDRDELIQLLTDAGVGGRLTRGLWASAILQRLDADGDGKISWDEFNRGIH